MPIMLGLVALPLPARADIGATLTLVQRLQLPRADPSQTLLVDLSPQAWRVGGVPASAAQLRSVLARLERIEVTGLCGHAPKRRCAFALPPPQWAAIVLRQSETDVRLGWAATAPTSAGAVRFEADRYFALLAPERYIGQPLARQGIKLAWRYRTAPHRLLPSRFDAASAWLVLSGPAPSVDRNDGQD